MEINAHAIGDDELRLFTYVSRAENLKLPGRNMRVLHPFYKIGLTPSENNPDFISEPHTSSVEISTVCPTWPINNHLFKFKCENLSKMYILIKVYHSGRIHPTRVLGTATFAISTLKLNEDNEVELNIKYDGEITGKIFATFTLTTVDSLRASNSDPKRNAMKAFKTRMRLVNETTSYVKNMVQGRKEHLQLSRMTEEKLDAYFTAKNISELRSSLQTGDILLFSGTEGFGKLIKAATLTTWTHVCMIVKDPSPLVREAYGLDIFGDENIFVYESDTVAWDKRHGGGVQMSGMNKYLEYLAWDYNIADRKYLFVVRHLQLPPHLNSLPDSEKFPKLEEFLLSTSQSVYTQKKMPLAMSVLRKNSGKDMSNEYFCSELIAECYIAMELLCESLSADNYLPKDFSTQSTRTLNLLRGASLSNEVIRIISPEIDIATRQLKGDSLAPYIMFPDYPSPPPSPEKSRKKSNDSSATPNDSLSDPSLSGKSHIGFLRLPRLPRILHSTSTNNNNSNAANNNSNDDNHIGNNHSHQYVSPNHQHHDDGEDGSYVNINNNNSGDLQHSDDVGDDGFAPRIIDHYCSDGNYQYEENNSDSDNSSGSCHSNSCGDINEQKSPRGSIIDRFKPHLRIPIINNNSRSRKFDDHV